MMSQGNLESFGAYRKSLELFDHVVQDCKKWMPQTRLDRLVSQQIASADSISSNIEEGYGRESKREYRQFLIIARGSARETQGRYRRFRHWMPQDLIQQRVDLAEEVIRIVSKTIGTLSG